MADPTTGEPTSASYRRASFRSRFLLIPALLFAAIWPFLLAPSSSLYVRYEDAETFFDPVGKLIRTLSPWDAAQHLGFVTGRAMMYLSVQSFVYAGLSFLGPNWLARVTGAFVLFASFAAMTFYLSILLRRHASLATIVGGFFYAVNPFTVSLVHDGYFALVTQLVVLPLALAILELGQRRGWRYAIVWVAVLFTATSFYNVPLVLIDFGAILLMYGPSLVRSLRRDRAPFVALALVAAVNAFWIVPLVVSIGFHAGGYQDSETRGDVDVTAGYGSLTNVFLLRSYPEIWSVGFDNIRECSACRFYESPSFVVAMGLLSLVAAISLYKSGRRRIFWLLIVSLLLATSTRYGNELIGLPYETILGLPLVGSAFRGAAKFQFLSAFCDAIGIAVALASVEKSMVRVASLFVATLVVGWPMISGGIIERPDPLLTPKAIHGYIASDLPNPSRVVPFPNFLTQPPSAYDRAARERRPRTGVTLILPNSEFAYYDWGLYGNDFLPTLLRVPTIERTYLPEPTTQVTQLLDRLADPAISQSEADAILSAMRVSDVVYREDAIFGRSAPIGRYGSVSRRDPPLVSVRPRRQPLPILQRAPQVVQVAGDLGAVLRYDQVMGQIGRTLDASPCPLVDPIGFVPTIGRLRGSSSFQFNGGCSIAASVVVSSRFASAVRVRSFHVLHGKCVAPSAVLPTSSIAPGVARFSLSLVPGPICLAVRAPTFEALTILAAASALTPATETESRTTWPGIDEIAAGTRASIVSYNVASDDSFVSAVVPPGAHLPQIGAKFFSNGYANGFRLPARATLYVVQVETLGFEFGLIVTMTATLALAFLWWRETRRSRLR